MLVSSVRLALRASRSGPASLSKIAPGDFVGHSATSPKSDGAERWRSAWRGAHHTFVASGKQPMPFNSGRGVGAGQT